MFDKNSNFLISRSGQPDGVNLEYLYLSLKDQKFTSGCKYVGDQKIRIGGKNSNFLFVSG